MARKLKKIIVPDSQGNPVEYDVGGVDASTASEGQILKADGNGGTIWGDIEVSDNTVPTEVRQALFNLLDNNAFANNAQYNSQLAILQSWAAEVTSIILNRTSLSFANETAAVLTATTTPSSVSVIWATSDSSVAVVNNGVVTPVGNGNCTITASAGGKTATCAVSVSAFANLVSISAVYTQSNTVYDTDTLDSLKSDLVVTASYDNSTTQTVNDYTLSGTLAVGTSTIAVSYGGMSDSFSVTVSKGVIDTSPVITQTGVRYKGDDGVETRDGFCITKNYDIDITGIGDSQKIEFAGIIYSGDMSAVSCNLHTLKDNAYVTYWGFIAKNSPTATPTVKPTNTASEINQVAFSLYAAGTDYSYIYVTNTGQILFAGNQTKYYGMTNISEYTE